MYGCRLLPVAEVNIITPLHHHQQTSPINPTPPPPILKSATSDLTLLYTGQKKENDLWKHACASTFHSSDARLRLALSDELNSWSEALGFGALKNDCSFPSLPSDSNIRCTAFSTTCTWMRIQCSIFNPQMCSPFYQLCCRHHTKVGCGVTFDFYYICWGLRWKQSRNEVICCLTYTCARRWAAMWTQN